VSTRALVHLPQPLRRGEAFELRTLLQHPMETGFRADSEGRVLPRDIVRRFECRLDGTLVFAAELHPAIAANPYLAFWLRAPQAPGELRLLWQGDNGFRHEEIVSLVVA
jgi:sulfur-oxidizing protein SoxZ